MKRTPKFNTNKRPRKRSYTGGNVEDREQGKLMAWVKANYPDILCTTDIAGLNINRATAGKLYAQRNPRKGWPDVMIFAPCCGFSALLIEYKKTGADIVRQDGKLRATPHLQEQRKLHNKLIDNGFLAGFAVGLEAAKGAIKAYLGGDIKTLSTHLITDTKLNTFPWEK